MYENDQITSEISQKTCNIEKMIGYSIDLKFKENKCGMGWPLLDIGQLLTIKVTYSTKTIIEILSTRYYKMNHKC